MVFKKGRYHPRKKKPTVSVSTAVDIPASEFPVTGPATLHNPSASSLNLEGLDGPAPTAPADTAIPIPPPVSLRSYSIVEELVVPNRRASPAVIEQSLAPDPSHLTVIIEGPAAPTPVTATLGDSSPSSLNIEGLDAPSPATAPADTGISIPPPVSLRSYTIVEELVVPNRMASPAVIEESVAPDPSNLTVVIEGPVAPFPLTVTLGDPSSSSISIAGLDAPAPAPAHADTGRPIPPPVPLPSDSIVEVVPIRIPSPGAIEDSVAPDPSNITDIIEGQVAPTPVTATLGDPSAASLDTGRPILPPVSLRSDSTVEEPVVPNRIASPAVESVAPDPSNLAVIIEGPVAPISVSTTPVIESPPVPANVSSTADNTKRVSPDISCSLFNIEDPKAADIKYFGELIEGRIAPNPVTSATDVQNAEPSVPASKADFTDGPVPAHPSSSTGIIVGSCAPNAASSTVVRENPASPDHAFSVAVAEDPVVQNSTVLAFVAATPSPRPQPTSRDDVNEPSVSPDNVFPTAFAEQPVVPVSTVPASALTIPSSCPQPAPSAAVTPVLVSVAATQSPSHEPISSSAVSEYPACAFSAAVAEELLVPPSPVMASVSGALNPPGQPTSSAVVSEDPVCPVSFISAADAEKPNVSDDEGGNADLSAYLHQHGREKKRSLGQDWYKRSSVEMCEKILRRRQTSPNFRSTIQQRDKDYVSDASKQRRKSEVKRRHDLYNTSSPFRRNKSQSVSERIKSRYEASSPFRRKINQQSKQSVKKRYATSSRFRRVVSQAARNRYSRIVQSPSQLQACRKRQRECHAQRVSRKRCSYQSKTRVEQAKKFLLDRRERISRKHGVPALPRPAKGTAEESMQRFNKWKRHLVNYLLSFCLENSQELSWTDRQEQYQSSKLKIVRLVEQILNYQREKRAQLYKYCNKLNTIYNEAEAKLASTSKEQSTDVLLEFYGVRQYHVKTQEAIGHSAADEDYVPFPEVFPDEAETCKSYFRQLRIRVCDNDCQKFIPTKWPGRIHEKLKMLTFRRNIRQLLHHIYVFESCDKCDSGEELCSAMDECSDSINYLQSIAMHYSGIRSILVDLYRLRNVALDLHVIEVLFRGGTYQDFLIFKQEKFPDIEKQSSEDEELCIAADSHVMEKFGTLLAKFKAAVDQSMEIHECCHCLRLFGVNQIHTYERTEPCAFLQKPSICATIKDYEAHHRRPLETVILCNQCYQLLRGRYPQPSIYSYRNDMWPCPLPRQLQCLNAYEKQLISLCKSFQSIVKLYPMRYKGPTNTLVRAIKGLAVHVPLPSGTMKKVTDVIAEGVTLPDLRNLLIQVDSMPNAKKMVIFRSLVDIGAVEEALHWLVANNPLYKNVKVAPSVSAEPFVRFTDDSSHRESNAAEGEPDEWPPEETDVVPVVQGESSDEQATFDANFKVQPNKERQRKRQLSFFEGSDGSSDVGEAGRGPGSNSSHAQVQGTDPESDIRLPFSYAAPYLKYRRVDLEDQSSMLLPVQEDTVLEQYSLIPLDKQAPKDFDLKTFGMKPVLAAPLGWDDPYLDVASFPHLFPQGCNGLFHPRTRIVKPAFFIEHCFRISDPRFRRDLCFLFECAIRKDMMSICSQVYALLNCGKFGKVTAGELKKGVKDPEKSPTLEKNVSTMLSGIVGTPQYWLKVRNNLEAVIQEHGSATFFLTLSCAEYKNEDFHRYLILRNSDLPNVRDADPRHLLAADPVSVSRHFHKKFSALWDFVISDPGGPLGCVVRYYIRIEYQQRGAPHVHMLLWIKDAPTHGSSKPEHVLEFITKHITCTLPDATASPLLHSLVIKNQHHRCSQTCMRTKSVKGVVYCRYCRFGFPRKSVDEAYLNSAEDVLESKVAGHRKNLYSIKRTSSETNINDYNPALLLMWEANMDIQFINDSTMSLAYYTTGYVCKHEKQLVSDVAKTVNNNLTQAGMAKAMMCQMLRNRQMGAYEAADRVLRQPLYRMSDCVKTPSLFLPSELKRRLKPMKQIEELSEESTNVFSNNWQCQYYPKRPEDLESFNGYHLLKHYDIKYGKPKKENPLCVPELKIYFSRRRNPAVIRIWNIKKDDPQSIERYCFMLLALFRPWRCYEDLLKDKEGNPVATYSEALESLKDEHDDLRDFLVARKRYDDLTERIREIKLSAKNRIESAVDGTGTRPAQAEQEVLQTMDDELNQASEHVRSTLTEDAVKASYDKLNAGQRLAFHKVMEGVEGSVALGTCKTEPRRVFVSGVGGTGKSFLIKALREALEFRHSQNNQPAVFVAAPTGVGAVNVEGVTLHKLLKLPVAKTRRTDALYWPLHHEDVKMLWMLFRNCKLLIIDEVSMLSNLYLTIIHKRLNEILVDENKHPKALFGNLNVLLLGDLLQLSPVNAPHVFSQVSQTEVAKNFTAMGQNINLWRAFDFVELTENMRQRDDKIYAAMLNRIRIGSPSSEDLSCLRVGLVTQEDTLNPDELLELAVNRFLNLQRSDAYALCLMPKNDLVNAFNKRVLQLLHLHSIECPADDCVNHELGVSAGRKKKKKTPGDLSAFQKKVVTRLKLCETGGFEDNLIVAVGARVMLRRNLDLKKKLVNGSIGFVEQIYLDPDTSKAQTIHVRFQSVPDAVPVTRMNVKYCVGQGLFLNRTQFPLTLAYAITIHKCQGLSLNTAMIDIGMDAFVDGMGYVALSRVRKLQDLHLIRFAGGLLKCDGRCVREYTRLHRASGLESSTASYNTNPEFVEWDKRVKISGEDHRRSLELNWKWRKMLLNFLQLLHILSSPRRQSRRNNSYPKGPWRLAII